MGVVRIDGDRGKAISIGAVIGSFAAGGTFSQAHELQSDAFATHIADTAGNDALTRAQDRPL